MKKMLKLFIKEYLFCIEFIFKLWYYVYYVYLEYNIGLIVNDLLIYGKKYCDVIVIDFFLN